MENGPFEDVFPSANRDIPLLCSFTRGYPFPNHNSTGFLKLTSTALNQKETSDIADGSDIGPNSENPV